MTATVLVDLLFMDGHKGGMEIYAENLYTQFGGTVGDPGLRFVGLASSELVARGAPWFPGDLVDSGISGANRRSWARGELLAVEASARRVGASLIHSPANIGPWWGRVPVVLTVHDLLPFRLTGMTSKSSRVIRTLVSRSAAHAARIITDSEASRADIAEFLKLHEAVDVVPLAGGPTVEPSAIPREHGLLLALGNRLPHKNFDTLLHALAKMPGTTRPRLVITGGGEHDPLRPLIADLGLESTVELAGWLTAEEVESLYARATAVVVPTLFEGFGLPVLEAMSRGCPVVCSDIPVLHEVGGDAAAYFDPRDVDSVVSAISAAIGDPARLAELARLGRERSEQFSWIRTAQLTAASFHRALAG